MNEVNILIWDIETSPMISYNWSAYQSDALEVIEEPQILCFAYKWYGTKNVRVLGQDDMPDYKPGVLNDFELVKVIHELFSKADIVVAHNGNSFDQKIANTRMIIHEMNPPEPYQQIDTKLIAKRVGRFSKNKLDSLGEQLGIGRKVEHEGWAMWKGVLQGDEKMWAKMKLYCKQDVALEEKLYEKLRPWITNHPSVSVITDVPEVCPKCGGTEMRKGGYMVTKTGKRKRYQCLSCGGWCSGRLIGGTKPEYIN